MHAEFTDGESNSTIAVYAYMIRPKFILLASLFSLQPSNSLHAQWVQTNGPSGGTIRALAVIGTNLFAATSGGVFLFTNNGTSWIAINSGLLNTDVSSLAVSGTNLFAGTHGGVYGVSFAPGDPTLWTAVNTGLPNPIVPSLVVSSNATGGTNLFAGTTVGIFLSTNSGASWTPVNSGLANTFVYSLAVSSNGSGGTNLFAGTKGGGIFRSTDNGTGWAAVNSGLTNSYVTTLVVEGVNLFAGALNGDVLRSTDSGAGWTKSGLTGLLSGAVGDTNIFAGTTGGVFLSTNHGTSWTAVNTGLADTTVVNSLAILGTNLFAGTGQNVVWSRPLLEITTSVRPVSSKPPTEFALEQNYPNPFNPSTTLRYGLPSRSRVRLIIYNIVGQVVADLVNSEQAAGWNQVVWNANVSSGLYFYRLEVISVNDPSKSFTDVKKMISVK